MLNAVATGDETTLGKLAQLLRMAISVTAVSPPIDLTAALIGNAKALTRVQRTIGNATGTAA